MTLLKKHKGITIYLAGFLILYMLIGMWFNNLKFYNITPNTNNDRLFSMDDAYYTQNIYSLNIDTSLRIIKHPFFTVYAHWFTEAERFIFGDITIQHHYWLIVASQIILAVLSILYLYLSLIQHFQLKRWQAYILTTIYGLSISVILHTMVAESYIFSSLCLIMTYYYSQRKKAISVVILGILTTGITLTNGLLWALLVIFSRFKLIDSLIIGLSSAISFLAAAYMLPIGRVFYKNLFFVLHNSTQNYCDNFGWLEVFQRMLYNIFGNTFFYVETMFSSPFGKFPNKAISFVPMGSTVLTIIISAWLILLFYSAAKNHKNNLVYGPMAVIAANLAIHVFKQYGLKEGFLYGLHHQFAQLFLVAGLFMILNEKKSETGKKTYINNILIGFLVIFIIGEVVFNLMGFAELQWFLQGLQ
jgi:hypothetical protein